MMCVQGYYQSRTIVSEKRVSNVPPRKVPPRRPRACSQEYPKSSASTAPLYGNLLYLAMQPRNTQPGEAGTKLSSSSSSSSSSSLGDRRRGRGRGRVNHRVLTRFQPLVVQNTRTVLLVAFGIVWWDIPLSFLRVIRVFRGYLALNRHGRTCGRWEF